MKHIFTQRIYTFFFIFFLCCVSSVTFAQDKKGHCGSDFLLNNQDAYKKQLFEQKISNAYRAKNNLRLGSLADDQEYAIPVVFHIVHQGGNENISDQDVFDGLRLLNDAFANVAPFDPSRGTAINISFCLGGTSITRDLSALTNMTLETNDDALKKISLWDPEKYINIWVVQSINSINMGPAVAGYATLPYAHGAATDGIVIEANFVKNDPDAVKVLVHEMGHYLGLYHTFEGGCKNDDCTVDGDKICDTPPDASTTPVLCNNSANTCHSDSDDPSLNNPFRSISLGGLGDQPDMIQNYMDYGFQDCQNTFTDGQRTRMRTALTTTRSSLLDNPALCLQCDQLIVASMNLPDVWPAGVPVTLSVVSARTDLQVIWLYNGKAALAQNITETFDRKQRVTFDVYITDPLKPGCSLLLHDTIQFECPVPKPGLSATPTSLVNPGQTVHFTTTGTYNYSWKVDGVLEGTGLAFDYTATGKYGRMITLVADNGTCKAESEPYNLIPGNCTDSKENNTWYFGDAGGIDFNQSPAKAIPGRIYTDEGSAVFCDDNGKPLFYSNGELVANDGIQLLNGGGLSGHYSTTQSALFVPQPGNNRYVYLFTVAAQAGEVNAFAGICYSVIDRLGDGGRGEVIEKNHLLSTPVVEKVTAVKNSAGDGIWIITHLWNSNAFHAWLLTSSGISNAPVVSNTGMVYNSPVNTIREYAIGELKSSYSGKRLAAAMQGQGIVEVFDFDTKTGVVSNPITLKSKITTNAYGVCFSPNERFLYTTSITPGPVIRFDLQAGNQQAIMNAAIKIGTDRAASGSVQLAPDGKLYFAKRGSAYLSVLYNPNAVDPTQCGFLEDGFQLYSNTTSYYGLPNPVQSLLFSVKPIIAGPEKVCRSSSNMTVRYRLYPLGNAVYSWTHKGPNTLVVLTDSTVDMHFKQSGIDTLIVKRTAACADMYDTLYIFSDVPPDLDLGPDRSVCKGSYLSLDAGFEFTSYLWSNGEGAPQTFYIPTDSVAWVRGTSLAGCIVSDSVKIHYYQSDLDLGRDTSICLNESLTLHAPADMDSYVWSTGENGVPQIIVSDSGTYVATLKKYGCTFIDTIQVWKGTPENVLRKDTLTICAGMPDSLYAPNGFDQYIWKTPSGKKVSGKMIRLQEEGYYVLNYQNRCGAASDSVYYVPIRMVASDTMVTCADTISFTTLRDLTYFSYSDQRLFDKYKVNGNDVTIFGSGNYVAVGLIYNKPGSIGCMVIQTLHVLVDTALIRPERHIDLGPDTSYCEGKVLPLKAGSGFDSYRWNTGSRDSSTTVYGFGMYTVNARYCGYTYTDTIMIHRDTTLKVDIGQDQIVCAAETFTLDADAGFDWYQWSDGNTNQQTITNGAGVYTVAAGRDGCIARDTMQVFQGNILLKIYGDTLLCPQENIYLKHTHYSGISFVWSRKNATATSTSDSLLVSEAGTYYIKNNSCPSLGWDDSLTVKADLPADPGFILSADSTCLGNPVTVMFDATKYKHFQWDDGSTANPRTFNVSVSPQLIVRGNKCTATYTLNIPVKNNSDCGGGIGSCNQYEFYLAPNPGTDYVVLGSWCKIPPAEKIKVRVTTVDGKVLTSQQEGTVSAMNDFLQALMPQLAASMYIVEIVAGGRIQYIKWIVLE